MTTSPIARKRSTTRRNPLEDDIVQLAELKAKAAIVADEIEQVQGRIIEKLDKDELKNHRVIRDGSTYDVTLVSPERVVIDEQSLAKKLGAATWHKITTEVLDKVKLTSAIKAGTVSEVDVASVTTINKTKRFIKLTRK